MIEGCGVPHTEVELIVVDGRSVGFDYRVRDGDRIGVFPMFESFDVSPLVRVRPEPLRDVRFVADVHRSLTHGTFVRETDPERQVAEIVGRFHLTDRIDPFTRCMVCNGTLRPVEKREIAERIPPGTSEAVDDFHICTGCGQVFWEGAHAEGLDRIIDLARQTPPGSAASPKAP